MKIDLSLLNLHWNTGKKDIILIEYIHMRINLGIEFKYTTDVEQVSVTEEYRLREVGRS